MQVFIILQHAVCDCIQSFRKETNMRQKCSTGSPIYITHWKQGAHIARTHPYTNSRPAQVRVSQNRIIFNPLFTGDVVNFCCCCCCCCSGNTLQYWWSKYVSWAPRPSYGNSKWQLSCCNAPINVKPAGGGRQDMECIGIWLFFQQMSFKFPCYGQIIPVICKKISPPRATHDCLWLKFYLCSGSSKSNNWHLLLKSNNSIKTF